MPVESRSPADQLFNGGWPLFDQGLDSFDVAEAVTSGNGVVQVQFDFVIIDSPAGIEQGFLMYPDFLGIGAQKAGTTWLHTNLRPHPQIWMPPIKELHYLDKGRSPLVKRAPRADHPPNHGAGWPGEGSP